ncbi:hypothetical protein B0H19DRAFT_1129950 [Mycena capillaripes]|nr:hypothetical protein B0H19DRAFT_1129950 [Mycena capillaripes]
MSDAAAQLAHEIRGHDCLHLLGVVIMYFDALITLDREISFLWQRAGSASTYWFFAVRYTGFAGNIPVTVFSFYTLPLKWCHAYHLGHQVVLIGTQLIVSTVMILRVYALYQRSVRLLLGLLALSLPLLAVVLWATQDQHSSPIEGFPGCHVSVTQSTSYRASSRHLGVLLTG